MSERGAGKPPPSRMESDAGRRSHFQPARLFKMWIGQGRAAESDAKVKDSLRAGSPPRRPFGFMGGPFTRDDLRRAPADWEVGPPGFVGVGVPKAGTTWWYSLMTQHPKVAHHRLFDQARALETKELHYFVHFGWHVMAQDDIDLYREAFAAPPGGVCGEWSVLYLCHTGCVTHLARSAPDARVIVMLRNPIDRMVSHVNHLMRNRTRGLELHNDLRHFFEVFSAYPEATLHSQYGSALKRLLVHFPKDRILVIQYERCRRAHEEELARTFRFLGVDDDFVPRHVNTSVNRQDYVIGAPTNAERTLLAEHFQEEVRTAVELFPEIDVALWPDFKGRI